jgi:hypothetical protein
VVREPTEEGRITMRPYVGRTAELEKRKLGATPLSDFYAPFVGISQPRANDLHGPLDANRIHAGNSRQCASKYPDRFHSPFSLGQAVQYSQCYSNLRVRK